MKRIALVVESQTFNKLMKDLRRLIPLSVKTYLEGCKVTRHLSTSMPEACRRKSIILVIFLNGRATTFFFHRKQHHYTTSIYSLQTVTRRIMEISLLFLKRIHRNLEAKKTKSGISCYTGETPSIRKYQSHSIEI